MYDIIGELSFTMQGTPVDNYRKPPPLFQLEAASATRKANGDYLLLSCSMAW
jgi:hypothetical protein